MSAPIPTHTDIYSRFTSKLGSSCTYASVAGNLIFNVGSGSIHGQPVVIDCSQDLFANWFESYLSHFNSDNLGCINVKGQVIDVAHDRPREASISTGQQNFEMISDLDKKIALLNDIYEKEKLVIKDFMGNSSSVFDRNVLSIITMVASLKSPTIDLELRDESTIIFKLKLDSFQKINIRYHLDEPGRCTYSFFRGISLLDNGVGNLEAVILDVKKIISQFRIPRVVHSNLASALGLTTTNWKYSFENVIPVRAIT